MPDIEENPWKDDGDIVLSQDHATDDEPENSDAEPNSQADLSQEDTAAPESTSQLVETEVHKETNKAVLATNMLCDSQETPLEESVEETKEMHDTIDIQNAEPFDADLEEGKQLDQIVASDIEAPTTVIQETESANEENENFSPEQNQENSSVILEGNTSSESHIDPIEIADLAIDETKVDEENASKTFENKSRPEPNVKGHSYTASQAISLQDLPAVSAPPPKGGLIFGLCVVDFNHLRGPEIEYWIDDTTTSENQNDKMKNFSEIWPQLPFQALPDGAHLFDETFSNFTLVYDEKSQVEAKLPIEEQTKDDSNDSLITLFGCACIRQLDATKAKNLKNPEEVKRSVIQKSVVLITRYPITIQLKEKLSIITATYFHQHDFEDRSLIDALYENISSTFNKNGISVEDDDIYEFDSSIKRSDPSNVIRIKESDFYMGFNLKNLVLTFKRDLMVLFKAILLEKRVLFFSKDLHKLSNMQYSLLSLIPNLIFNLQDSAYPLLNSLSQNTFKPTSLKSSDRNSMLRFLGLPMHILDRGGFFQPYLSLQQLDYLTNPNTKWYIIGSSNDLLLDQKKKFADILVQIDEGKIEILDTTLKPKLALTSQDRKFIDLIVNEVTRNSAGEAPVSPIDEEALSETINNNMAMDSRTYIGGDDFVRWSFEDYLVGLLSTVKYDNFLKYANDTQLQSISIVDQPDQIDMFNTKFIDLWKTTHNYSIFDRSSDDELFNFFEPKHQMGSEANGFADKFFKWSGGSRKSKGFKSTASSSAELKENSSSFVSPTPAATTISAFTSFFEGFQKKNKSSVNVDSQKEVENADKETKDKSDSIDSAVLVANEDECSLDKSSAKEHVEKEAEIIADGEDANTESAAVTKPISKFFNNAWSTFSNLQKK